MAITISGTDGIVGAGFTVDASGVSVTAGVGTFSSIGAGTSVTAAGLTGALPTISGANLHGVGITSTGTQTSGIIQVVQVVKTDTSSTTSFTSWTDIGPSASIIASNANSKIMIEFMLNIGCTDGRHIAFRLEKDGSAHTAARGDDPGDNKQRGCFHMYQDDQNGQHDQHNYVLKYIETAGDTNAHSYNIAVLDWGGQGTTQITCNRSKADGNQTYESRTFSTCTLTELAA